MNPVPRGSSLGWWAMAGLLVLTGCGGETEENALGCFTDERVPPRTEAKIEAAAKTFYERVRRGDWEGIYRSAASRIRDQQTLEQFITPLTRVMQMIGVPPQLTRETMTLVRFGGDFPPVSPVECTVQGEEAPRKLLLGSHPAQASLVQTGAVGQDRFYYSTLWSEEKGEWRLTAFFAKPATLRGNRWEIYEDRADEQRLAGNERNAALLYNVAIDLVVPNAWTEPPEVSALQRKQKRLSVRHLPTGEVLDRWPATPDTFLVRSVQYTTGREKLGILFRHEAVAPLADSTAQKAYADRFYDFIRASFPEYPEVFDRVVLVTLDPDNPEANLVYTYPLGEEP